MAHGHSGYLTGHTGPHKDQRNPKNGPEPRAAYRVWQRVYGWRSMLAESQEGSTQQQYSGDGGSG